MFSVKQHRQFTCSGYAWTIYVECTGAQLSADGVLASVDYNEFWQWLADHVTDVPNNAGVVLGGRLMGDTGPVQAVGDDLGRDPAKWTAERFAAVLLASFREISDTVQSVTVLRNRLFGFADDTVECTVRANDAEPVTAREMVATVRRLCALNALRYSEQDNGPPEGISHGR
jgi:hypothetical protein